MITLEASTAIGLVGLTLTVVGGLSGVLWSLRSAVVKLNTLLDSFEKREDGQDLRLDAHEERIGKHDTRISVIENTCKIQHGVSK